MAESLPDAAEIHPQEALLNLENYVPLGAAALKLVDATEVTLAAKGKFWDGYNGSENN